MVLDFAKELPEDDEIVFEDIPGLSGGGESVQDQFTLVDSEVRRQLEDATRSRRGNCSTALGF